MGFFFFIFALDRLRRAAALEVVLVRTSPEAVVLGLVDEEGLMDEDVPGRL